MLRTPCTDPKECLCESRLAVSKVDFCEKRLRISSSAYLECRPIKDHNLETLIKFLYHFDTDKESRL